MAISDDIRAEVKAIFEQKWTEREGAVIPESKDLGLTNDAVKMSATVLYADLAESTNLVNTKRNSFAAEIYKTFLIGALRIINHRGGEVTAFDGDRIMAVFNSNRKNTEAAKAALNINWAVTKVVNEELKIQYPASTYVVRQAVGIDTSDLFIARTGIRGTNDLVWVGRAANYAAKLCTLRNGDYVSYITKEVYDCLLDESKNYEGKPMWEERKWTTYDHVIYRSSWWVRP